MKVTVIKQYQDKYTGEKHFPGEVLSVSAERMAELALKEVIDKIPTPEDHIPEEPVSKEPEEEVIEETKEEVVEEPKKARKPAAKKRTTRKKG